MAFIWGDVVFDEESLNDLEEIFVYVDLLSAIIAVMVYYDQRRVDKEAEEKVAREGVMLQNEINDIKSRIDGLEEKMDVLIGNLLKNNKNIDKRINQ